ncbi:MAG: protein kinase [Myxococcales bacterium]|nr:protein kinase [Myxococcales bacterium]
MIDETPLEEAERLKRSAIRRATEGEALDTIASELGIVRLTLQRWLEEGLHPPSASRDDTVSMPGSPRAPNHESPPLLDHTGPDGRFQRLELLGEGGMGAVYRAWDSQYSCAVALKIVRPHRTMRLERFKEEFRRAACLSHPNLVTMYDLVVVQDRPCFSMELIDGAPLRTTLPLAPSRVHDVAVQLFAGLTCLHDHGIVHRDIKPANVLRESTGRVVIVDFGLAVLVDQTKPSFGGTLPYMAPELFQRSGQLHAAVDVYAAGVLLAELLLGRPWRPDYHGQPVPEEWLDAMGTGELADVVRACLEPDPRVRPLAGALLGRLPGRKAHVSRPRPRAGFVGRTAQLAWLDAHVQRGSFVRVAGPGSIGKSALLTHALDKRHTISSGCHPAETVPFNGFDRAMGVLARRLRPESPERITLSAAFPAFGTARQRRGAVPLMEDLAAALARAMDDAEVSTLWIDDAQWLDRDSTRLLRALVELSDRAAVVATHRLLPEDHPLRREGWFVESEVCTLGPMDRRDASTLAHKLVDDDPEGLLDLVGPHPFRLEQFAPHWQRGERVVPPLAEQVQAELSGHPAAMEILELVAVHGAPLPVHVLASPFLDQRFPKALAVLTRSRRLLAFHSTQEVAFTHDTTLDALLEGLDPATRRSHHELLARAFQRRDPSDPGSAARHFALAGNLQAAHAPAVRAARDAEAVFAWARAADFYGLVASRSDFDADTRRAYAVALSRCGLAEQSARQHLALGTLEDRRRAAELLVSCGAFEEGDRVLGEVLRDHGLAAPTLDAGSLLRVAYWSVRARLSSWRPRRRSERRLEPVVDALWTVTGALGQFDSVRTLAYHGQHLVLAKRSGDVGRWARAAALLASYANIDPESPRHHQIDAAIDELLRTCDDPDQRAWVLVSRGYRAVITSRFADALHHFDRAEAIYRKTRTVRWERTLGWTNRLFALVHLGRLEEAKREYRVLIRRFEELGDRASIAIVEAGAGAFAALADADPQLAVARLDRGRSLLPEQAPVTFTFLDLYGRVAVDRYVGDLQRARERVQQAWPALRAFRWFRMPAHVLAYLYCVTHPTRRNVRWARRRLSRQPSPYSRTARDELALLHGDDPQHVGRLEEAERQARQAGIANAADAFALRRARATEGDTDAVIRDVARRGVEDPPSFLRLWGA